MMRTVVAICTAIWLGFASGDLIANEVRPAELTSATTWTSPRADDVRDMALRWLQGRAVEAGVQARAAELWNKPPAEGSEELLDRLAATFALGDPKAQALIDYCGQTRNPSAQPDLDFLGDKERDAFERNNLRLFYARWLVQQRLYDEAIAELDVLQPEDVADPAALLFYQSVAHHQMPDRDKALRPLGQLLEPGHTLPRRYASLARLMQADLAPLKDESLDHIARRMQDIRRRLDLGRAGPKVRAVEDGVIKSLDKLIEEMEKQAQQAAAAAAAGGQGQLQPTQPMPDSRIARAFGPGKVDNKKFSNNSGWGNLPPKQRQEALQQIGKDFPSHYRDVVEQYFRKLATDEDDR